MHAQTREIYGRVCARVMRNKKNIRWFPSRKWKIKKNYSRKNEKSNSKKNNYHPSIVVGEKGSEYANIGITSSKKRGHHKNEELHNRQKNGKPSYIRDDIQFTNKKNIKEDVKNMKLHESDLPKIRSIIEKFIKKSGKH